MAKRTYLYWTGCAVSLLGGYGFWKLLVPGEERTKEVMKVGVMDRPGGQRGASGGQGWRAAAGPCVCVCVCVSGVQDVCMSGYECVKMAEKLISWGGM